MNFDEYNNYNNENNNSADDYQPYSDSTNRDVDPEPIPQPEPQRTYYTPYDEPKRSPKKKSKFGKTLLKCVAIALVFGIISGAAFKVTTNLTGKLMGEEESNQLQNVPQNSTNNKVTTTNVNTQVVVSDVTEVVDNALPAIVSITNISVQTYQNWFGQKYSQEIPSAGSGIIVAQTDKELYIATNNHVVADATTLTVSFIDNTGVEAQVKGTDASTDLAVITVQISDIPQETLGSIRVATIGNSNSLKLGEPSIAIGNALGYGISVTTGVISAVEREVTVTDGNTSITNSLIQTDAAINPGNSGGALLNINGEVIGINSVKYSDTDVEGMGFAIPMATAEPIINELITREKVDKSQTAYLGIAGVDVTDEISEYYNLPKGISVQQVVTGSAAEQYGIKKGDIIIAFDGKTVETMGALQERMQYYAAGSTVEITLLRAEAGEYKELVISVVLGRKN